MSPMDENAAAMDPQLADDIWRFLGSTKKRMRLLSGTRDNVPSPGASDCKQSPGTTSTGGPPSSPDQQTSSGLQQTQEPPRMPDHSKTLIRHWDTCRPLLSGGLTRVFSDCSNNVPIVGLIGLPGGAGMGGSITLAHSLRVLEVLKQFCDLGKDADDVLLDVGCGDNRSVAPQAVPTPLHTQPRRLCRNLHEGTQPAHGPHYHIIIICLTIMTNCQRSCPHAGSVSWRSCATWSRWHAATSATLPRCRSLEASAMLCWSSW